MTEARKPSHRAAVILSWAVLSSLAAKPVLANGEIVITQAKAVAGNVTPGDSPGFPITLSLPGAYELQSNLTVPAGTFGISVTTSNVDIDMNGFTLSGGGTATYGVMSSFGESRIHDGVVTLFLNSGIHLRADAWIIKDMQIARNGEFGVDADSAAFTKVEDSVASGNGKVGVRASFEGTFHNSTFSDNGAYGILCFETCLATGNTFNNNFSGLSFFGGLALGNTISRSKGWGMFNSSADEVGTADNMLINNNLVQGVNQIHGRSDVHPNTCIGKPC